MALDPGDLDLVRRGFSPALPAVRPKLDAVVSSFAVGYNAVLIHRPEVLTFSDLAPELRGFAFEGAAMSAVLLDQFTLSKGRRLDALYRNGGQQYVHLLQVGAGWAFARLRVRPWTAIRSGRPVLRWLAWDGWGFHQAFFNPAPVFGGRVERNTTAEVLPIRDQGVGRALWFYAGADPARVREVIESFAPGRRADLWAGIGLAASYTGAQSAESLEELVRAGAGHHDHLAQGAAFGAKAHHLSGIVTPEVTTAVKVLTGAEPQTAAGWTDDALATVQREEDSPRAYANWRAGIRRAWSVHTGGIAR